MILNTQYSTHSRSTHSRSKITREIHAVKKTREFHDSESENIRVESELICRCGTIYNVQSVLKLFVSVFPGYTEFLE